MPKDKPCESCEYYGKCNVNIYDASIERSYLMWDGHDCWVPKSNKAPNMFDPHPDYVKVTRCNDCVHRLRGGYCKTVTGARATKPVNDNFFCGYGERRDEDATENG